MAIRPGTDIGNYHILEQLGKGGMAIVYKAFDKKLRRDVAFKVIRADLNDQEKFLKRFKREAKALIKLTHPNIVGLIDFDVYEGDPYIVMEYISGGNLMDRLKSPMSWEHAATLLVPIADALGYAHKQGILHRDVKPSNILITDSGQPMISDFGVAKELEPDDSTDPITNGLGLGTPEYMAPEQFTSHGNDQRADIYSLGVVFYEMVVGRKPFIADTPYSVAIKQSKDPLPRPRDYIKDLPDKVEQVIFKALEKDPKDRYQDMQALHSDLRKLSFREGYKDVALHTQEKATGKLATGKSDKILLFGLGCLALFGLIVWGFGRMTSPSKPEIAESPVEIMSDLTLTTSPEAGIGSTSTSPKDGMIMVFVPAGDFLMGSSESEGTPDEHPQHTVYLDDYWIDETEVSNDMFSEFVNQTNFQTEAEKLGGSFIYTNAGWEMINDANWQHPQGPSSNLDGLGSHPVVHVSWDDAQAYCSWAGKRLPTEAEWEKAARGTQGQIFPWGNGVLAGNLVNFADSNMDAEWADTTINDGFKFSAPVGSFPDGKSPYGALDMAGNVWEWVSDWKGENYYQNSPTNNPTGPDSGELRGMRGGSWGDGIYNLGSAVRGGTAPDQSDLYSGIRCALDTSPSKPEIAESPVEIMSDLTLTTSPEVGIGSTSTSPKDGMTMVFVPAGDFLMGSSESEGTPDEHPQHTVYLDDYWIDETEVSNDMFSEFVNQTNFQTEAEKLGGSFIYTNAGWEMINDANWQHPQGPSSNLDGLGSHPVVHVSWDDAQAYCSWAGKRLPTEAEWEKAARGTQGQIFPWGNGVLAGNLVNFADSNMDAEWADTTINDGFKFSAPVGSFPDGKSPYGALDMSGNVWEWVSDWKGENYYENSPTNNPTGPDSGEFHGIRGGSWYMSAADTRAATRYWSNPASETSDLGLRCAFTP